MLAREQDEQVCGFEAVVEWREKIILYILAMIPASLDMLASLFYTKTYLIKRKVSEMVEITHACV